ncbi:DUF4910 domain-containing protein [Nocardioides ungokensis]|uniref:DUF4910 domain-containing protein n=1 Tax=Nocardioides ungokensis TaxID=1643322 RepID=UPI0024840749|nr:DUF4910 domain-containing protein [Nocardioides ungokensis]
MPPVARQRQPLRHRGRHRAGPHAGGAREASVLLPVRLRAGDDRVDHLAEPQRRAARPDPARAGAHRSRRPGAPGLQEDPTRDRRSTARRRTWCGAGRARSGTTRRTATTTPVQRDRFDLPVGRLTRTPHGEYPEYHTSADNLGFLADEKLLDAYDALLRIVEILENDAAYLNLSRARRAAAGQARLYPTTGGRSASDTVMAMLWTLAYSDGRATLLDIADRAGLDFGRCAALRTTWPGRPARARE